jgi:hypothetical protein
MEDWPLYVLLAQRGSICHMPDVMATYRMHGASAWSSTSVAARAQDSIVLLETIDSHLPLDARRRVILRRATSQYHLEIAVDCFGRGDVAAARAEVSRALEDYAVLFQSDDLLRTAIMRVRSGQPAPANEAFLRALFAEVLPRTRSLGRVRSRLIALTYMHEVFAGLRDNDSARVDTHLWQGVRHHPAWLRNRGVLATAARSVIRKTRACLRDRTTSL